ncbi:MAG: DUF1127 domain-containing protein [Pseudomonadota bacterium]
MAEINRFDPVNKEKVVVELGLRASVPPIRSFSGFQHLYDAFKNSVERQFARRALYRLSVETLRDIGIERYEIDSLFR